MAKCKKCGAPMVWVTMPKSGKWFPCDEGLVEYKADPDGEDLIVTQNGELISCTFDFQCKPDGLGRIPHWATCPYADDFRKRGVNSG